MSDGKPSHAYWNGIEKYSLRKRPLLLLNHDGPYSELQRHPVVAPQTRKIPSELHPTADLIM